MNTDKKIGIWARVGVRGRSWLRTSEVRIHWPFSQALCTIHGVAEAFCCTVLNRRLYICVRVPKLSLGKRCISLVFPCRFPRTDGMIHHASCLRVLFTYGRRDVCACFLTLPAWWRSFTMTVAVATLIILDRTCTTPQGIEPLSKSEQQVHCDNGRGSVLTSNNPRLEFVYRRK